MINLVHPLRLSLPLLLLHPHATTPFLPTFFTTPSRTFTTTTSPRFKSLPPLDVSAPERTSTTNANGTPIVPKTGGAGAISSSDEAILKSLTLGAPRSRPTGGHYLTKGGVQVTAHVTPLVFTSEGTAEEECREGTSGCAIEELVSVLDERRGVLLSSSYEFPGRYARWSLGFSDPPLELSGRGQHCRISALNDRGRVILPAIIKALEALKEENNEEGAVVKSLTVEEDEKVVSVTVVDPPPVGTFEEEERSKQPSLFSIVRAIIDLFSYTDGDGQLGLYGAFGYDLTFQFEPISLHQNRDPNQRDLLLYLPDKIVVVDQDKRDAWTISYDFCIEGQSTQGLPRTGPREEFTPTEKGGEERDTPPNAFAESVRRAKQEFKMGNLFEVVLSQTFRRALTPESGVSPSTLYRRLRRRNPSPYGFFMNLGEREYLVGASPEMFVRCETTKDEEYGDVMRVETCPISGTVARGKDALEDAQRVKSLITNAKEESELTMCTDVDRNDKSRICIPGSVKVIGRRQIEMYSRLIHTVDHVEGYLRESFDALDAFLCHTWAVTVTGAPKTWAIQFVEEMERSPRCWYGGAIGMVGFDGGLNTGLTLRTIRVKDGIAEVRAGATLLYDSDPDAEELETELKASAMMDAILRQDTGEDTAIAALPSLPSLKSSQPGKGKSVILIDHQDSFVHTLGNYLRQTGATVTTLRSGPSALQTLSALLENNDTSRKRPDMVVLSPGPGNPSDFRLSDTIDLLVKHMVPTFGVCLGLQGMVEYFGGELAVLDYPVHGKPSRVRLTNTKSDDSSRPNIFMSLPEQFEVARYHSLYGVENKLPPEELEVTAVSEDDGVVMAIRHKKLPFAAVQFHPESILTSPDHGMTILSNALMFLGQGQEALKDHVKEGAETQV